MFRFEDSKTGLGERSRRGRVTYFLFGRIYKFCLQDPSLGVRKKECSVKLT